MEFSIIKRYENSFRQNRDLPAITDYSSGKTYSYFQLAAKVDREHKVFRDLGIKKGDTISIIGKNSADWICTYISIVTYGAVVVPILPDFSPEGIVGIINHSDSRVLYCDEAILARLDKGKLEKVEKIFTFESIAQPDFDNFNIDGIRYADPDPDDLMIISYTSGTTGTSKGVMLPVRSITGNVQFTIEHKFHFKGSRVLSILPLAHTFGCTTDMLAPLSVGTHVHVLGKVPVPSLVMKALADVKPQLICTVPLIIEKIVQKNVLPQLERQPVKFLVKVPGVNRIIYSSVRKKLLKAFGGNIMEIMLGGAALNKDVETFLKKIKFPFSIGYGMTECGPLICYCSWKEFVKGSCGKLISYLDLKLLKDGYQNGMGEICIKGKHVMLGYYKNPEATGEVLQDGWLHTGDLGYMDDHNNVYLRGRCKTMILTSSGQNIYPEEIESHINSISGVSESLVYEEDGKLYALVVPDFDYLKKNSISTDEYASMMDSALVRLNKEVAPYERVSRIKLCSEPFEKTPKQSIKRFLYPKAAKLI